MNHPTFEIRYRFGKEVTGNVEGQEAGFLPFEDSLPYRKPNMFKGQSNVRGYYWFATNGLQILCESRLELRILQTLDFDSRVVAVSAQPFELVSYLNGKRKCHVPDFFARLSSGAGRVIDVKPGQYAEDPDIKCVFDATRNVCKEVGWEYEVATEPDPVFISNLRWLAGFRKVPPNLEPFRESLLDAAREGVVMGDLLRGYDHEALIRPLLFHLLWKGALATDLSVVLSEKSIVHAAVETA